MPVHWMEVLSIVIVGAFWGCTNPLLRKGSMEQEDADSPPEGLCGEKRSLVSYLAKFRNVSVWLPYVLNQMGSVVFYYTLSQSDLSIASPACNGLALAFSVATSWWIGEKIQYPTRTILGAAMVVGGVALCLFAQQQQQEDPSSAT